MTPLYLVEAIVEDLKGRLPNIEHLAENQPNKKISIYAHDIPRGVPDTYLPFVMVTLTGVEISAAEQDRIATVLFTVGTYAGKYGNDWRDMLNISEEIFQYVLTTEFVAKKFQRVFEVGFEPVKVEDQPEPFIYGRLAAGYKIATPRYVSKTIRDYKNMFKQN